MAWSSSDRRRRGDVIRSGFPRFHRQVAAVVAGPADLRRRPEQRPRFAHVPVALPEMHTVRAEPLRQRHAVVDDERHLSVGADALQRLG
jgi:hypothetical protein